MDLAVIRILFIVVLTAACYFFRPFGLQPWTAAILGAVAAGAVIVFELRVRALSIKRLLGAVLGSVLGIAGAALFGMVLGGSLPPGGTRALLQLFVLMLMSYIGLMVGASKGDLLNFTGGLAELFAGERGRAVSATSKSSTPAPSSTAASQMWWTPGSWKERCWCPSLCCASCRRSPILLTVPAASAGAEVWIFCRRCRLTPLSVQIIEDDFPQLREVDLKLIELAKKMAAPIVTNDFNLSKVAQLHHVHVLNLNDLANSLKPLVLPGEKMNIVVLKEGKEYNQGVGYLDDGTMVVVDHARRMIGRAVEITVTSVLQTASGKMIFGKLEDAGLKPEQVRTVTELSS